MRGLINLCKQTAEAARIQTQPGLQGAATPKNVPVVKYAMRDGTMSGETGGHNTPPGTTTLAEALATGSADVDRIRALQDLLREQEEQLAAAEQVWYSFFSLPAQCSPPS